MIFFWYKNALSWIGQKILDLGQIGLFILCLNVLVSHSASAHAGHDHSDQEIERVLKIYQMAVDLTPMILNQPGPAVAVLKLGNDTISLNTYFWEVVTQWMKVYREDLEHVCHGCQLPSVQEAVSEAKDMAAQSFIGAKIGTALLNGMEHLALDVAQIGSKLGPEAMVAKIAAEVAETIGSKLVGGAGLHVLCSAFDAMILFGTRHIQTYYRIPKWAPYMGQGRLEAVMTQALLSNTLRRAQRKVSFEFGPIRVDEDLLREVDANGAKRWWGWTDEGKRAAWIRKLIRRSQNKIEHLQALKAQRAQLYDRSAIKKLDLQIFRLKKELADLSQVGRKEFLGTRYKRFLFLKSRKFGNAKHLNGRSPMDTATQTGILWILSVQENVLNRSVQMDFDSPNVEHSIRSVLEAKDYVGEKEVREGLAKEFLLNRSKQNATDEIEHIQKILLDIEKIFDPKFSREQRYLQANFIEATMSGFLDFLTTAIVNSVDVQGSNRWLSFKGQFLLRWKVGKVFAYVYEFSDFLRIAAGSRNQQQLARFRYEAMDTFLRIFNYMQTIKEIPKIDSEQSLMKMVERFENQNLSLKAFRPWVEKKSSWNPLGKYWPRHFAPRCEMLAKGVVL